MSYSGPSFSPKEVLLQPKRLVSYLRTIRRSQDDEEEREHLVAAEDCTPQFLHNPLPPPLAQSMARGSLGPDLDDTRLSQHYARVAQGILLSLSPSCRRLGLGDINLVSTCPVGGGGFADIYEATHDGRKVVLKSYRCYVSFNIEHVVTVCRNHDVLLAHC